MSGYYILNEYGNPKEVGLYEWSKWFEKADRHVATEEIRSDPTGTCEILISTVFLGLDHSFGAGPPLLFETMIFGGKHDQYQDRYATMEEALEGHATAVEFAKNEAE
jgi:hypothetical protein